MRRNTSRIRAQRQVTHRQALRRKDMMRLQPKEEQTQRPEKNPKDTRVL